MSFDLALVGASLRDVWQRVAASFKDRIADLAHPYRPELHYMRGPGPKWREKHRIIEQSRPSAITPRASFRPR